MQLCNIITCSWLRRFGTEMHPSTLIFSYSRAPFVSTLTRTQIGACVCSRLPWKLLGRRLRPGNQISVQIGHAIYYPISWQRRLPPPLLDTFYSCGIELRFYTKQLRNLCRAALTWLVRPPGRVFYLLGSVCQAWLAVAGVCDACVRARSDFFSDSSAQLRVRRGDDRTSIWCYFRRIQCVGSFSGVSTMIVGSLGDFWLPSANAAHPLPAG